MAGQQLAWVHDALPEAAQALAGELGVPALPDWREGLDQVQAVMVSTPNGVAPPIVEQALAQGLHVLVEKPMGRNLEEATRLAEAAAHSQGVLKIGFNHRYHPALSQAHRLLAELGPVLNLRASYGHGGRPGYEKEWRGDPQLAGGGVLLDQGVHIADLMHWFGGLPRTAYAQIRTVAWNIAPLEDTAMALLTYEGDRLASFQVGWTQWKNLFRFEIFGSLGSLHIEGLGGSYGEESLTWFRRRPQGGVPDRQDFAYPGPDLSWQREWDDFLQACQGQPYWGTPQDGLAAMRTLDALYRSAAAAQVVHV